MKTLRTFAAPEDYDLESPVMNAHQKSTIGNALIRQTMERYYRVPEQFDDLVYVGLVLQDGACVTEWRRTGGTVRTAWGRFPGS